MRCGRKFGNGSLRIASILLVLLLVLSPLAAWPTRPAKSQPQPLQIIPVEAVEAAPVVLSPQPVMISPQSPSPALQPETSSQTNSTELSNELTSLLESLKDDDRKDSKDLADLRATISEIKSLLDIQTAANKDLEKAYVDKIAEKDAEIAQLKADYRSLSSQYDQVVFSLAKEQGKPAPHNYHVTIGMGMLKNPTTGDIGWGADLVYRIAGPFTILGGAHFFPEQGRDIIYKAGVGISF